jgi:hypothetical protein
MTAVTLTESQGHLISVDSPRSVHIGRRAAKAAL